ncbi:hypothetical protein EDB86DRAFT_2888890 [Lactarius hatsudake]|nr:hypothetical protein EDB86DRAFT_2888890 [Lactarius hatsudake]
MQSLEAQTQHRNSLHCAYHIFTEDRLRRFLTGTTPRLARLVMRFPFYYALLCASLCECTSDERGIVLTIYERVIVLIGGQGL